MGICVLCNKDSEWLPSIARMGYQSGRDKLVVSKDWKRIFHWLLGMQFNSWRCYRSVALQVGDVIDEREFGMGILYCKCSRLCGWMVQLLFPR